MKSMQWPLGLKLRNIDVLICSFILQKEKQSVAILESLIYTSLRRNRLTSTSFIGTIKFYTTFPVFIFTVRLKHESAILEENNEGLYMWSETRVQKYGSFNTF